MPEWCDDNDLFSLMHRELFTAVVGDVLDRLGFRRQFLPPEIRPLRPDVVVVGRAMPVLERDISGPTDQPPFGKMLAALDDLRPHEVYLAAGASPEYAQWGELMSTAARARGAAGAVIAGYIRDTLGILALGFPVFCTGSYAQDQAFRGEVVDFRLPLTLGQACVRPGDILFGDADGVLVIPREVEEEAIQQALARVRGEKEVQRHLREGMPASEAFRRFGIL